MLIFFLHRSLAQKWHPDHYEGKEKEKAEKMFIDIAAAKEVLTDEGNLAVSHFIMILLKKVQYEWKRTDYKSSLVELFILIYTPFSLITHSK